MTLEELGERMSGRELSIWQAEDMLRAQEAELERAKAAAKAAIR